MKKNSTEMYTKDKLHRVTVRFNDKQFEYLTTQAEILDVSVSEYIRMVINGTMYVSQNAKMTLDEKEDKGRENDKSNIDN